MADSSPLPWDRVHTRLEQARNYWVTSTDGSGRPHARPVWGLWWQDTFVFNVGRTAGTARNLAVNPAVGVHLESAEDVVIVEGVAEQVTDPAAIPEAEAILGTWAAKYQQAPDGATDVDRVSYLVRPRVVLAWTLERFPHDLTRWRLAVGTHRA